MTNTEKKAHIDTLLDFLFIRSTAEANFYDSLLGKQFDAPQRWASLDHRKQLLDTIHYLNDIRSC